MPVLSANQVTMWAALRAAGGQAPLSSLSEGAVSVNQSTGLS